MKSLKILALLGTLLLAFPASADDITLAVVNGNIYQHTANNPCVIGGPSCPHQPSGFPWTLGSGGGNVTSFDLYSPVYTVGQIIGAIGSNTFYVGLDVNQTSKPQTLTGFEVIINGVVVHTLVNPFAVPAGNNGNGWADYLISRANGLSFSLAGLSANDTVQFRALYDPANDGPDYFFLVAGQFQPPPPVVTPEPASLFLMGTGLIGFGRVVRKRFKKV